MYCSKCGNNLNSNSKFCSNCGNKVINNSPNQNAPIANPDQMVKLLFIRATKGYFAQIGIYIDNQKIAESLYWKTFEAFVTVGQHTLTIKDSRTAATGFTLNITPDIKTVYIELYYALYDLARINNVRVERLMSPQQETLDNNNVVIPLPYNNPHPSIFQDDDYRRMRRENEGIPLLISGLSSICPFIGLYLEQPIFEILAIILGILAFNNGAKHYRYPRGFARCGIIFGFGILLYLLIIPPLIRV